jgi:hypothetical protein
MNSNFDFSQSLVLEDEKQTATRNGCGALIEISINEPETGSILWCVPMVEKI